MNRAVIMPILFVLAACADQARIYPMDNVALQNDSQN
jgi:hypothetical protein